MSKAVTFSRYGGPEVLQLVDAPELTPGPGQVRVAIRAAGVNPFESKVRRGLLSEGRPLEEPRGLGSEMAGVVDRLGHDVTDVAVGDELLGHAVTPAYAEHALADPTRLVAKPGNVPWDVAGGVTIPGQTAHRALTQLGVTAGDTLLIHAAAGGVGLVAVQIAREWGATVIGTASEPNHDSLRSLGATPIMYGDGLAERVLALSPGGVDAVLDASGRGELPVSIELTGDPERVITIAAADAAEYGVRFSESNDPTIDSRAALSEVVALLAAGRLVLPIWKAYPLAKAQEAHAESERGHLLGKIVLVPA